MAFEIRNAAKAFVLIAVLLLSTTVLFFGADSDAAPRITYKGIPGQNVADISYDGEYIEIVFTENPGGYIRVYVDGEGYIGPFPSEETVCIMYQWPDELTTVGVSVSGTDFIADAMLVKVTEYLIDYTDHEGTRYMWVGEGDIPNLPVPRQYTDGGYRYIGTGWTPRPSPVTSEMSYGAVYVREALTPTRYTVTLDVGADARIDDVGWAYIGNGKYAAELEKDRTPNLPIPTREFYSFDGWEPDTAPLIHNITYVAKWSIGPISVNYDEDKGAVETIEVIDKGNGTADVVLKVTPKDGYHVESISGGDVSGGDGGIETIKEVKGGGTITVNFAKNSEGGHFPWIWAVLAVLIAAGLVTGFILYRKTVKTKGNA
jgi:hypothetical protein